MRSSGTTAEQADATAGRWPWWYSIAALAIGSLVAVGILQAAHQAGGLPAGVGTLLIEACFIAATILIARQCGPVRRQTFGLRRMAITPGRAFLWMFLGIIGVALANAAYVALLGHVHLRAVYPSDFDKGEAIVLAVAAVVAAPIAEELLFRGLLYRALRNRIGVVVAVAISAVIFGVMHWWFGDPPELIFPRVSLGVVLALLYERSGSLYPSIALHVWVNLGLAGYLLPELRGALGPIVLVGAIVAIAISARDPRRKKFQRQPAAPEPDAPRFTRTPQDAPESVRHLAAGQ